VDGSGSNSPHFSLRSLYRAIRFARDLSPQIGHLRALYEGLELTFVTPLAMESRNVVASDT
jgi:midasin (ATPase involved in ribosome maturation)